MNKRHPCILSYLTATVCALFFLACPNNDLQRQTGRLTVVPVPSGQQTALDNPKGLDVGQVPLGGQTQAVFLLRNDSSTNVEISSVVVASNQNSEIQIIRFPKKLGPAGSNLDSGHLIVGIAALADGQVASAVVHLNTNAGQSANEIVKVQVQGTGLFVGDPNIQVCFNGTCYPQTGQCVSRPDFNNQIVCTTAVVDFGNVPLDTSGTQEIQLRNVPPPDTCLPPPGSPPCTRTCLLNFDRDANWFNVGVGFAPDNIGFSGTGIDASRIPFALDVPNPGCNNFVSELRLLVSFDAGPVERIADGFLLLESNDPDSPLIEVPLAAAAKQAPVAVARIRECDAANPPPACNILTEITPLGRAYLDGSASFDPRDPTNSQAPSLITAYRWEIINWPAGANPAVFDVQGEDTPFLDFFLPLAGRYVIRLHVTNNLGIESGITATSDVEVFATPSSRLHLQLVWDNPINDQDLHLVYADQADLVCADTSDCFWRDCKLDCGTAQNPTCVPLLWFAGAPFAGPNPRLDIDNTHGYGPENINIDDPVAGRYRVYVHYYGLVDPTDAPTLNTVRIYIDGQLQAEYRRTLARNDLWRIAEIQWNPDNSFQIVTAQSDDPGVVVGAVKEMNACSPQGFDFGTPF